MKEFRVLISTILSFSKTIDGYSFLDCLGSKLKVASILSLDGRATLQICDRIEFENERAIGFSSENLQIMDSFSSLWQEVTPQTFAPPCRFGNLQSKFFPHQVGMHRSS